MNKKLFIIAALISTLLGLFVSYLTISKSRRSFELEISDHLEKIYDTQTYEYTKMIRGDLLNNFSRNAYNFLLDIVENQEHKVFLGFSIEPINGNSIGLSYDSTDEVIEKIVPVYFSSGGEEWGRVRYFISKKIANKIVESNTKASISSYFMGILISFIIILAFSFLLAKCTSRLVNSILDYTETDTLTMSKFDQFVWAILYKRMKESEDKIRKIKKESEQNKQFKAIARTTQMIAHDVRKPFSILQMGLMLLEKVETIPQLEKTRQRVSNSVSKATSSVNVMLSDVLDIGHDLNLDTKNVSFNEFIFKVLSEISLIQKVELSILYNLNHFSLIRIDEERMKRVFLNIISNAMEAIGKKSKSQKKLDGQLIFSTFETEESFNISLKNTGSWIPSENLPKVFDAFYTEGKTKGTGLGLSIAKKVVEAHGGSIEVRSSESEHFVEFFICIEKSTEASPYPSIELPASLDGYRRLASSTEKERTKSSVVNLKQRNLLAEEILNIAERLKRPIKIGIIDDEEIYRSGVHALVESHRLSKGVEIVSFSSPEKLFEKLLIEPMDYLISDVDLNSNIDGFELTATLSRKHGNDLPICIHSNKAGFTDAEKAFSSGAKAFMPKPMTIDHLLKFVFENKDRFASKTQS